MRRTLVLVLVALTALAVAPPAGAERPEPADALTRVIVQLEPTGPQPQSVASDAVAQFGGKPGFTYQHAVRGFAAELPTAAIEALRRNPNVISVTPDRLVSIAEQVVPSGFDRTEADLVPRAGIPGDPGCPAGETCTDVDIAIIDTGISTHPDLNVVARTDCSSIILPGFGACEDGQGDDGNGHGTHVAGTAAAFDNDIGVVGIAPGARLHSVKALGDDGTGFLSAIIAGVDWATARADVIDVANMSLSGAFSDPTFDAAIAGAVTAGITVAVAAGNDGVDAAGTSPANHPDVITVSAVSDADGAAGGLSGFTCRDGETDDTLATFSNFGAAVDIAAPGTCIRSTYKDQGYATGSGTSAASPHVAGAAALYVAINGRDVNGDLVVDKADADAVKAALIAAGQPQGSACGFTGDTDGLPEPLLFVNGPTFGGDGTCEQEPVDLTAPSAPAALQAVADGYAVDLSWTPGVDPDSGILEHRIYRDTVPASGEVLLATTEGSGAAYRDEDTTPGETYTYEVEAVNLQFGESGRSNAAEATIAPDDPTNAGWWALDDGAGTEAVDATPWRRSGTLVNGPNWISDGKIGGALELDGDDDRVDLDPAIVNGFGDVTFATWIRTTKAGTQSLVSGANEGNSNELYLQVVNDTSLRFFTGWTESAGVEWSMLSIADGLWHHLAVVRDDGLDRVTAYRDGVSLGTYGLTQPMETLEVEALLVGQDQDTVGGGFQAAQAVAGGLDDIRIYTRVLTQSEIDEISQRDLTGPSAPSSLSAVARGAAVDLAWSPADDAESGIAAYDVWRDDGAGGAKTLRGTVSGTTTVYRDAAVRAETTYVYEVVARNGGGIDGPASPEATVVTEPAGSDLLGWWALDDAAGSNAADWSSYGRDGTLSGDPAWGAGRIGGALVFDGSGDMVDLDASVLDGADAVSLSLWFKTTKDGIQAMVSGANAGNDAEFELIPVTATTVRFYTGESNVTFASWTVPSISDGDWHHAVVLRDGAADEVTLYLDGVDYGAVARPLDPLTIDPGGLVLGQEQDSVGGGFDASQAFLGTMDEVRLYDRLLSATEIQDLAEQGDPEVDGTAPGAPVGVVAVSGDGVVSLDWVDNVEADVASYSVYRSSVSGGPYVEVASGLVVSEWVDVAVTNGLAYFYVVTAVDAAGNESVDSVEVWGLPEPPPPSYAELVASDGAFAWWRLGDSVGTTAADAAGSHVATYMGGVTLGAAGLLSGDGDHAAAFDGVNDYIAVKDAADINTGGPYGSRSIELWFRADDVSGRQVIYEEGGTTRGLAVYLDEGDLYVAGWNVKRDDATTPWGPVWVSTAVAAGTTYHLVLVFDHASDRLAGYLNGVSFGSASGVGLLFKHSANVGIGSVSQATRFHDGKSNLKTGHFFAGVIDEVALYGGALSPKQITGHWTAGSGG